MRHPGRAGDLFDPRRTGLDHVAFEVADREELTSWTLTAQQLSTDHGRLQRAVGIIGARAHPEGGEPVRGLVGAMLETCG